jgi:tetratricopeptide (TPR) repeat protein
VLVLVLVVGTRATWDRPPSDARARARALHAHALDRLVREDRTGWIEGLRAALAADSSFIPAVLDLLDPSARLHPVASAILDSLSRLPRHPLSACARAVRDGMDHQMPVPVEPGYAGVPACARLARVIEGSSRLSARERAEGWDGVRRDAPESALGTGYALAELADAREWVRVAAIGRELARSPIAVIRVKARGYLALALHWLGRHDEAIAAERQDLEEVLEGAEALRVVWMDVVSSHTYLRSDTLDSSITAHLDSLALVKEAWSATRPVPPDPWLRLQRGLNLAGTRLDRGDLTGSLDASRGTVSLADSIGDPGGLTMAYMVRGRAAVKAGESVLAERSLLTAREHVAAWGSGDLEYQIEHNLLHLYEGLGRWEEARQAGHNFVAAAGRARLTPVRMMSHRDMGWFLRRRGEWEAAQRHFGAMVATIDSLSVVHEYPFYAGEYYESIGDLERARTWYGRITDLSAYPRMLEALVRLSEATGDTAGAVTLAAQAERMRVEQYPEHRALLPGVLARAGRYAEAVEGFERARRGAAERGQIAGWARLSVELARVTHDRGQLQRAAALGDSAAAAARQVADHEFAVRAAAIAASARGERSRLSALARDAGRLHMPSLQLEVTLLEGWAHAAAGDPSAALATYRVAQALADSIAGTLELDPSRAGFRATQLAPSSQALGLTIARRHDPRAVRWWVEWSARRKSRETRGTEDPVSAVPALPPPPGVALVDYAVLDSLVAAAVVTHDGASIQVLPITPAAVRAALAALYAGVAPRVGGAVDGARARVDARAMAELGQGLLAPLTARIGTSRAVIVVPDGPLHLVPFDALPLSEGDSAPLVLDRYLVHLAPTLAAARSGRGELVDGRIVVVAGDDDSGPVPGVEREVAGIREAETRRPVTWLSGPQATEDRLRAEAGGASILHLAAHARPNHHNPDMSDVLLRPGAVHDGRLQAHEIRTLPLSGVLVVLSACETAAGRVVAGEGPLSLSRAFLQAGAGQVVATLWPVGESAADLMSAFYREMEAGSQPAQALRAAKQRARAAGLEPIAWAPFTLVVAR